MKELVLAAGVHPRMVVDSSVRISGSEAVVAGIEVAGDDLDVVVVGVEISGGRAEAGGGVSLTGYSVVTLERCRVVGNRGQTGGGAYANRGSLVLRGCDFSGNAGGDVMATGVAEVRVEGGTFAGDVAAREGARVTVAGAVVEGVVDVRGTTSRAPEVVVRGGVVRVRNDEGMPGVVRRE